MRAVPFFRAPPELAEAAREAGVRAFAAGHATGGPEIDQFEAALAEHLGHPRELTVATLSGTAAITAAARVAGVRHAVLPGLTWNATPNAVAAAGARVTLCDVRADGTIDPAALEALLAADPGIDAVVPVSLYGNAYDAAAVAEAAARHGAHTICDGCQSFERGRDALAAATALSFHALKSLPLGIGGAALFTEREHADAARVHINHGVDDSDPDRKQAQPHGAKAQIPAPAAAMGTWLLENASIAGWLEVRQAGVERYARACAEAGLAHVTRAADDCAHAFVVLPGPGRGHLRSFLSERGIGSAPYYHSLFDQRAWGDGQPSEGTTARAIGERATAIPLFAAMTGDEVEAVAQALADYGRAAG